ncbi:MAG: hypothetical protein UU21_C0001G0103 [Candidatus Levybacteria bacterium GW2011_GWA2_40_8]|nr:MAG: hypothetical protein UU21_C0001G0103 [Candidatus Levybacteria bacterium GW2011_GWA2_40_8]
MTKEAEILDQKLHQTLIETFEWEGGPIYPQEGPSPVGIQAEPARDEGNWRRWLNGRRHRLRNHLFRRR